MPTHAREDEAASDADFEWVNHWAAAATAQRAPVAAPIDRRAELAAAPEDRSEGAEVEQVPESPSEAVPLYATARRRKRWTHLFRIITREGETESAAESELSLLDAQAAASQTGGRPQTAGEGNDETTLDFTQIDRDIAEIELVRDRLMSEFAPARQRTADRWASARTSDYVPIVVGGVLAFTSLVVFGAAASFVSLR